MPKLFDVHQWGKFANLCATYEIPGIDNVTKSTVHRQCRMKTTMQDDDNTTDRLHILSWPRGQLCQKTEMGLYIHTYIHTYVWLILTEPILYYT